MKRSKTAAKVTAKSKPARPDPASRGERRKRDTRERLLQAAFRLFAERGADAVPINEITEAADVGFGSFYNHFASREAIHQALLEQVFEEFGKALDALSDGIDDPAEVISVCVRHTIQRAKREPLWATLLLRNSLQPEASGYGLGPRLLRDIQRGIRSERFATPDPLLSFIVVGSSVLGAITAQLHGRAATGAWAKLNIQTDDLDTRTAAAVLHALGLSRAKADSVSRRPLPSVPMLIAAEDHKS
jgi:AcrR family transcriptional regulator